jgi:hypothetical protein
VVVAIATPIRELEERHNATPNIAYYEYSENNSVQLGDPVVQEGILVNVRQMRVSVRLEKLPTTADKQAKQLGLYESSEGALFRPDRGVPFTDT